MIENEHLRNGYEPTRSEDLFPQPTRFESVRAVRAAADRDPDLDDEWWANGDDMPPAPPEYEDMTYAEFMASQGFVQVMFEGYGLVWRHK